MKRTILILAVVSSALLFIAQPTQADLIYSTFGSGNSYDHSVGWMVGDFVTSGPTNFMVAASFTPDFDSYLSSIDFAAWKEVDSLGNVLSVQLTDINAINIFESFSIEIDPPPNSIYTVTSNLHPVLSAGTEYWIVLSAPGGKVAWNWNDQDILGGYFGKNSSNPNWLVGSNMTPAFAVDGTPVPEPSAMVLLGSGLAGLIGYGRRRMKK